MRGQFASAAAIRDERAARDAWAGFIQEHDAADGWYEDAMHARLVEWAKLELQRIQFRSTDDPEREQMAIDAMRALADGG